MKTLDTMMLEIYKKSAHWRFYVENKQFCANNQYEDLIARADSLESIITKVWLHYFGNIEYRITTTYFTELENDNAV